MSTSQAVTSPVASLDTETTPDLQRIGIELEYPLLSERADLPAPAALASSSGAVRSHFGRGNGWLTASPDDYNGYVGSDHVGAEITSGILELHEGEPERWYNESIQNVEDAGYEFAASGYGSTTFGLHMHMSELSEDAVEYIDAMCESEWARVFCCASVSENSLDPWRHGGVRDPANSFRARRGSGHYEWRLPEPMLPDHFSMVMEFLRTMAHGEYEAAEEYAREAVMQKDSRLTPIQQYEILDSELDDFPSERAFSSDSAEPTDAHVAEWFHDLMQSE